MVFPMYNPIRSIENFDELDFDKISPLMEKAVLLFFIILFIVVGIFLMNIISKMGVLK